MSTVTRLISPAAASSVAEAKLELDPERHAAEPAPGEDVYLLLTLPPGARLLGLSCSDGRTPTLQQNVVRRAKDLISIPDGQPAQLSSLPSSRPEVHFFGESAGYDESLLASGTLQLDTQEPRVCVVAYEVERLLIVHSPLVPALSSSGQAPDSWDGGSQLSSFPLLFAAEYELQ